MKLLTRLNSLQISRCVASNAPQRHSRAVKAVPIRVLSVSKADSPSAVAVADEWAAKVARYTKFSSTSIKPNPGRASEAGAAVKAEGQRVLKQLGSTVCLCRALADTRREAGRSECARGCQDRVIVLDERGRGVDSYGFSRLIAEV